MKTEAIHLRRLTAIALLAFSPTMLASAVDSLNVLTNQLPSQGWNWHVQNTDILDAHPSFPAQYSGPNSLNSSSEIQETVSLDILAGVRLWPGAEAHIDGLMWQGFGFSKTLGIESFPNTEAFRVGTKVPNVVFTRAFLRQTIGLGGEQENIEDDALHLAGKQDISRVTLTVGKFSAKDLFDNNAYANDPRTQFLSWGLSANEAWDYPADSLGFITGFAAELNQPQWTLRYGFFQVPKYANGLGEDEDYLKAWAMVAEYERRFSLGDHPGAVRLLGYLNRARMGSYEDAADSSYPADITQSRRYRSKYGFGLNVEQELIKNVGAFARIGWSDGRNEAWNFSDVDHAASLGLSLNGTLWHRTNDTYGVAGVFSGASRVHQYFLANGGLGILAGDGALHHYGIEQMMETYYDFGVWKTIHIALDYQFVANPAFNEDRGPVSVFSARLHWEF